MQKQNRSEIEQLAETVTRLASPDITPKKLMEAVRKEHPKTSQKDVTRAAFYAVIKASEVSPERAKELHDFAMDARNTPEDTEERT